MKKVLEIQSNKTGVVRFFVSEWNKTKFAEKKEKYETQRYRTSPWCWRISGNGSQIVPELACSHEEADTRMLLHARYADGPTVLHADDTDVYILFVALVYMKLGKGSKSRILNINTVKRKLLEKRHMDVSPRDFIRSSIGTITYTSCDTVFCRKG